RHVPQTKDPAFLVELVLVTGMRGGDPIHSAAPSFAQAAARWPGLEASRASEPPKSPPARREAGKEAAGTAAEAEPQPSAPPHRRSGACGPAIPARASVRSATPSQRRYRQ